MDKQVDLKKSLKQFFGFSSFKGLQEPVIKNLLSDNDTFVIMPTGGGKSMCYQLPALLCEGTALVVSPLIALMKNQMWNPDADSNAIIDDFLEGYYGKAATFVKQYIERMRLSLLNDNFRLNI
ncbi:MAG: DUF4838 domain-containing protein, partial [Flavobacteriaceae bacterium]